MSVSEILAELEQLSPDELSLVREKLELLNPPEVFEETPEELAAIDEGLRSAHEEPLIPVEDVMKEIPMWTLKSS